jgi:hypothetical protein
MYYQVIAVDAPIEFALQLIKDETKEEVVQAIRERESVVHY